MDAGLPGAPGRVIDLTFFPTHDHFGVYRGVFVDDYTHDHRCMGECPHGGGCQLVGMPCDQRCHGCNSYLLHLAGERGLVA